MTNIPTELLRTLVAVVELRSFTKAAQSLGVTQPAVSAQIKRLQALLDSELLDKSAPGVSLTPAGELVINYARRLLAINDQILHLALPAPSASTIRIGGTGDFMTPSISRGLHLARQSRPELHFTVYSDQIETLLRDLRDGDVDLVVWVSSSVPAEVCPHTWDEEVVWVRGPNTSVRADQPVPLVSYSEDCLFTRCAIGALNRAERKFEFAFVGRGLLGLAAAVSAGFGVMALPRSRADIAGVSVWEDAPLPKMQNIHCGIYVRGGPDAADRERIAESLIAALRIGGPKPSPD